MFISIFTAQLDTQPGLNTEHILGFESNPAFDKSKAIPDSTVLCSTFCQLTFSA